MREGVCLMVKRPSSPFYIRKRHVPMVAEGRELAGHLRESSDTKHGSFKLRKALPANDDVDGRVSVHGAKHHRTCPASPSGVC